MTRVGGTTAGCGTAVATDGIATSAVLRHVNSLVIDVFQNYLFFVDDRQIRRFQLSNGAISSIAGRNTAIGSVDGIGTASIFQFGSSALAIDKATLFAYTPDTFNNRIRRVLVSPTPIVTAISPPIFSIFTLPRLVYLGAQYLADRPAAVTNVTFGPVWGTEYVW